MSGKEDLLAKILVIDDERTIRALIVNILKNSGHETAEAESGHHIETKLDEFGPDVVITDIIMPDSDGIETIRSIRQHRPQAKIIAMSGGGPEQHMDYLNYARRIRVDEILQKPFSSAQFLELIERVLQ